MDDSAAMSDGEAVTDFNAVTQNLRERHGTFGQALGERLAFEILHDEVADAVLRAHIVEVADVGMTQGRDGAGFAIETGFGVSVFRVGAGAFRTLGGEDLDGDGSIEAAVAGAVHLPHTARAEARLDLVGPKHRPRSQRRGRQRHEWQRLYPPWKVERVPRTALHDGRT